MQNRLPSVSASTMRVVGIAIPVDPDGAQRRQAVRLRLLLGRAGDMQIEVEPRVVLRRRLAGLQGDHGPGPARRDEHRGPAAESVLAHQTGPGAALRATLGDSYRSYASSHKRLIPAIW